MASADVDINNFPTHQDSSAVDRSDLGLRQRDELDELFDFVPRQEGVTTTVQSSNHSAPNRKSTSNNTTKGGDLGIDEEIKVRKPRLPVAKLDEERLVSANGIPKLRRISKTRLRFRGKGHEFSDIARLLNTYQLWLDDLFPKAKFSDGIAMIEKLGHKKRIQVMRRAWIDDGRYESGANPSSDFEDSSGSKSPEWQNDGGHMPVLEQGDQESGETSQLQNRDLYSASPIPSVLARVQGSDNVQHDDGVGPDEDELDALLEGMNESLSSNNDPSATRDYRRTMLSPTADAFADEEEVMAQMDR